ncbi:insulin-like growth factor-binding protein 7 [Megalops cyprinoides]|uniref:insulin-like growth factor-binding protein 7 n=1 Tax=Megalops cyprinoides TaxID=118141 RepID=UPI001864D2B4|nr:insulin-like growth factor-binding protein 7 [Megalops cyprinoides]
MLRLFALVATLSYLTAASDRVPRSCGTCDPSLCDPLPADGCQFGTLQDSCGCCSQCAAGPGEPCGGRGSVAKRCASGLECVKNDKVKKSKLGVCICKSDYEVCGTDGVTYKTGCDLKAASLKAVSEDQPEIKVQNKGKCAQAPVIVTAPAEVWNVTGSQVYLSCEVSGIPTPVLTWKKVSSIKGRADMLPGDKDNLAIQTRGGPEKHEVTGWVLISPLTESDEGTYECHAANSKGEASAVGTIHVVASVEDIPTKKVPAAKDEEL